MRNIKLVIQYDGTKYNGWQAQRKGQKTIQATIEKALRKILQERIKLIGSGRTDSGVHAKGQVANFKTKSRRPATRIKSGLNAVLPHDIVIKEARQVLPSFHARYDAKSKIYRYTILNRDYRCAFENKHSLFIRYKLDVNLMKKESRCLLGLHNFKSFQAADKKDRTSIRTIKNIRISKKNGFIMLDFEADGFLYKMVRNITGALIDIGRGRFKEGYLRKILKAKNRKFAGTTAAARGLCLLEVKH